MIESKGHSVETSSLQDSYNELITGGPQNALSMDLFKGMRQQREQGLHQRHGSNGGGLQPGLWNSLGTHGLHA